MSVPKGAAYTAEIAFRANFDFTAASSIHTTDGGLLPPPRTDSANGTVSSLTVTQADKAQQRYTFTAVVDVDGPGPIPAAPLSVTVVYMTGSGWAVSKAG